MNQDIALSYLNSFQTEKRIATDDLRIIAVLRAHDGADV